MCCAMKGERERAKKQLSEADVIARQSADSALSYIEHKLDQEAPILIALGEAEAGIAVFSMSAHSFVSWSRLILLFFFVPQ